jgi:hypothetical protein
MSQEKVQPLLLAAILQEGILFVLIEMTGLMDRMPESASDRILSPSGRVFFSSERLSLWQLKPFSTTGRSTSMPLIRFLSSWLSWPRQFPTQLCFAQVLCRGGLDRQRFFSGWVGCPFCHRRRWILLFQVLACF